MGNRLGERAREERESEATRGFFFLNALGSQVGCGGRERAEMRDRRRRRRGEALEEEGGGERARARETGRALLPQREGSVKKRC